MKRISQTVVIIVISILYVCLNSCKEEESFTEFPAPDWTVATDPNYSVSMTAVVILPANLSVYAQADDRLAAFVGNECRGVAYRIDDVFYLLVKGAPSEQVQVNIRYYSTRNKYMYTTDTDLTFEADAVYGTADEPMTLSLSALNN